MRMDGCQQARFANWNIVEPEEAILLEKTKRLPKVVYQLEKYSERRFAELVQELHQIRRTTDAEPFVLVVGTDVEHYQAGKIDRYNSSLILGAEGEVRGRYDKMHLVMFGEYIPFGEMIPALYDWTPLMGGLTPGEHPSIYEVAGRRFAPQYLLRDRPATCHSSAASRTGKSTAISRCPAQSDKRWLVLGIFRS